MVGEVIRAVIGGTRFSAQEAQALRAAVRGGLTRADTRALFRDSFARGLPNAAFAGARRELSLAERAGITLQRSTGLSRVPISQIPKVQVTQRSGRFLVTAKVNARLPSTGETISRFVRFTTDEPISMSAVIARSQEIIERGVTSAESAMEVSGIEESSIVEQELVG